MYALVVYESMFGNTAAVARAVAEGLATGFDVVLQEVATAVVDDDVSLLVVGAPTHVFGMSRPNTRQAAKEQGGNGGSVGLRESVFAALTVALYRPLFGESRQMTREAPTGSVVP